jgi:hypothetical protein
MDGREVDFESDLLKTRLVDQLGVVGTVKKQVLDRALRRRYATLWSLAFD